MADNTNIYTFLFEEGASNPTNLPAPSTSIGSQVITGTVLENLNDTISKLSGVIKDSKDKKVLEATLADEFKDLGQDIAAILQKKVKSSDDPSLIDIDSVLKSFTGLLNKKLMGAFDALETKGIFLSKRGRAMVSKKLEGTVASKTPTGTMQAINKLHKDVKESAKAVTGAAKVIKDAAGVIQNKTDSPVTKVRKGLAATKEGIDVYKSGKAAAKELSSSAKVVRTALRSDMDTLIQYYKKAEEAGKAKVSVVREKYQKDPVALGEDLIKTFSKSIQQVSPDLANTELVKTISAFSGKIGDLDKLVKAAEVFANEADNLRTSGASVDMEALAQSVSQFSVIVNKLTAYHKQSAVGKETSIDNVLTNKMLSSAKKVSDAIEMEVTKLADGTFKATPKVKATTKEVQSDLDSSIGKIALPVKPVLPPDAGKSLSKQISNVSENLSVSTKPSSFKNLPHKRMFTDDDIANLTENQKAITVKKSIDVGHVVKQSGYTEKELQVANTELDGIVSVLDKILKAIVTDKSTSSENILYATALLKEVQERGSSIPELAKIVNREVSSTSSESRNFYDDRGSSVDTTVRYLRDFLLSYTPDQVEAIRHGVAVAPSTTKVEVKASDVKVAKSTKAEAATVESKSEKQTRASFDKEKQGLPRTKVSMQHDVQPKPEYRTRQEDVHTYTGMAGTAKKLYNAGLVADGAERIIAATELNRKELNESLSTLKSFIIGNIDATLKNAKTGEYKSPWRVVREREDQPISDYFKLAGGYNKKTSGKQYAFQLANVSKLVEEYNIPKQASYNIPDVIEKSKNEIKNNLLKDMKPDRLVETIGSWIKQFSKQDIKSWQGLSQGDVDELVSLKGLDDSAGIFPSEDLLGELYKKQADFLQRIYKSTVGEMRATDVLEDEKGLVRTIAIPAAVPAITSEGADLGANIFETQQGSSRVLPKFATYKSGFEEMYDVLKDSDSFDIHKDYATKIKDLGYRPKAAQRATAEDLSKDMLKDYASSSYETRAFIAKQFDAAAVIAGRREKRLGVSEDSGAVLGRVITAKQTFGEEFAKGSEVATEKFIDAMEQAGVSAYDFVRSLERVDFENIYQVMQRILTDQPKSPSVLTNLANAPWADKKIRDFENALGKLVGTIPIVDQARPRRYAHQEKIVNMMTMTSPIFSEEGTSKMSADDQKTFIRDLNKTLREYVADTKALTAAGMEDRKLPLDVYDISSLGVPESQAATLNEYRFGGKSMMNAEEEYEKVGELSKLNATALKMYTDDLTSLMPFGAQFQQKGRNIASTTNAYTYVPDPKMAGILGTTTPALQSQREHDLIKSGRLGEKGYGFNVTAELRNTASTFEDQILISGKLADVLTQTVKTMVAPDKLGSANLLDTLGSFVKGGDIGVSDIEEGKVLADVTKAIEPLNKVIQNILGVKEEYKGRADKALIREVTKAVTVVRGKDLNVQLAKIIETFFDYYGRKFTTRAGSKGVAISPTGTGKELTGKDIERIYSAPVKVLSEEERSKAGLGTAIAPKSMGELASEILDSRRGFLKSKVPDVGELQSRLESSGNKFMLDMFKDPSLKMVSAKEAAPQVKLFSDVKDAFSKFGINLEDGVKGIEALKDTYKSQKPEGELFKEKTIDIRISSFGLAKRGLQPENLETIMNNIINSKGGDPTVIATEFAKETYSKFLGQEDEKLSFSKLSEVLGYSKAYDTTGNKAKDLELLRSDMKDLLAARGVTEDKPGYEDKLNKLVELEKNSSYYSNIFDEFGDQRKSLVGSKFVEIVENPQQYASWSSGDIQKQKKGTKLNLPAYGAYASIFGEDSAFMGQMSEEIPLDTKKHWEYIKALQSINPTNVEARQSLLGAAQEVDISDIYDFQGSTGVMASKEELADIGNKRDEMNNLLNDTILDASRFPGAVNLRIPSTSQPDERESVYIPSAIARSTYDEPAIAGHQGLDLISRRIQILASAAKKVDDLKSGKLSEGQLENLSTGRLKKNLGDFRKKARTIAGNAVSGDDSDPAVVELKNMLNRLSPALKTKVDPKMLYPSYSQYYNDPGTGESKEKSIEMYMNEFFQRQVGKGKPMASALAETIEQAVDNIIGPYEDPTSPNVKGRQLRPGAYSKSASVLGKIETRDAPEQRLTGVQNLATALQFKPPTAEDRTEQLQRALKSLEKAKIEYYNTLADTALGKTGSVQEVIFSRKIPSVMAKAVQAVVDKTAEFNKFEKVLEDLSKVEITGDSDLTTALSELSGVSKEMSTKVTKKHEAAVEKHTAKGLPVLGQHELGIPKEYAEKIPAVFDKKFRLTDYGELERVYPTEDKPYEKGRNLAELLKYREMLESNRGQLKSSPADQETIQHILDKEVTPYVESVRFPFTGTSSVQPYKAKLLTGDIGEKSKHALMAPGLPEMDVAAFKKILSSVEGVADKLVAARELEQGKADPSTERIAKLTETINVLDQAISDVIPKYIAQQQKLDFDGDQIQVHAAKTMAARKEIEQHFKTIADFSPGDKRTTARTFMDQFTFDALEPSTGKYTLAEQQLAFEKKFPTTEGFSFLEKPFLTKELDYLSSNEQLGILANQPGISGGAQGPLNALKEILPEVFKEQSKISEVVAELNKVAEPKDIEGKTDDTGYANALIAKLVEMGPEVMKPVAGGMKEQLYDAKYLNAINAQLFKINTGRDTESLNRILKVFERNVGFGGGIVRGGGEYARSEKFTSRFPEQLKSLSGPIEEEFSTMMNEFIRVGIQKGLDVKHAGEIPIATEMSQLLSQGPEGVDKLISKITNEEGSYKALNEFYDANKKALERNFGTVSTTALREDAFAIAEKQDDPEKAAAKLSFDLKGSDDVRKTLEDYIVKHVGFEGFLRELSKQIEDAAREGILRQVASWDDDYKAEKLKGRKPTQYANAILKKQLEEGGIQLRTTAEENLTPLYGFRTSGATSADQLKKFGTKHKKLQHEELATVFGDTEEWDKENKQFTERGRYANKFRRAESVAQNMADAFGDFSKIESTRGAGSYDKMLLSTINNMRADQKLVHNILSTYGKESTVAGKDIIDVDIVDRLLGKEPLGDLAKGVLGAGAGEDIKNELERISRATGTAPLSKAEEDDLEFKYRTKASDLGEERAFVKQAKAAKPWSDEKRLAVTEAETKAIMNQVRTVAQLNKVIRTAETKSADSLFMADFVPGSDSAANIEEEYKRREQQLNINRAALGEGIRSNIEPQLPGYNQGMADLGTTGGGGVIPPSITPPGGLTPSVGGGVVPVHIESIKSGIGVFLGEGGVPSSLGKISPLESPTKASSLDDDYDRYYKYAGKEEIYNPQDFGMPSRGGDLGDEAYKNIENARQAMDHQAAYLDDLEKPPKPVYGAQAKFTQQALTTLHSKARDVQSERFGVSLSQTGMDKFNPKIKEEIEKVLQSGPRGTKFYNLLTKLKESDDTFSDADFTKAWKAYRVAVGDYYIQAMEDALANIGKQEKGSAAEAKAFSNYKDVVSGFQGQVKSDLGKATDIYTVNRSYVEPQAARDAGVFMDATKLANRGKGVLGEDDTLRGLFEKILDLDIHDKSTPVPRDTVGMILKELIGLDKELIDMYTDETAVSRYGTTLFDAMDFKSLKQGISRLREGLEEVMSVATKDQYSSEQRAHLDEVLKQLKGLEKTYINLDLENESFVNASGENIVPTIVEPPKQLPRKWQEAISNRNVAKLEDYFATPSTEGGPLRGDVYTYDKKAFGPNNKMMQHERFDFIKSFDYFDKDQGKWFGEFDKKYKNITKTVAEGNRTFSIAIERVIKWGAAATVVYGGMSYLKESVKYISDIEVAMAKLQMVMNPLSTNFSALEKSAIAFAKQYGVSIEHVLDSMRVFAQQGLGQQEVLDRTKTATVAENITDLSSTDATEALTAAMRVFNAEGETSMRFLDSWSEVESKAAIKAGDLADAIKKAASAGKNAGFTFDQLNGMVAAIGATTRQTGKEVGTSLRFIFNRLSSEKGPKTLGQFGISTQDLNTGQLRSGFDVLSDLSEKWDDLTRAQKLNVAQALGGTRQYNAVLTLMDNWDDTLRNVTNSINSKGSAERRNAILMKTYAKQVEQLKAAAGELKIELGKIVLPGFKVGVASLKTLIELFNNIPTEIKVVGAAFTAFFTYMIKGSSMIDSFFDHLNKGRAVFRDLKTDFKKGLDMSAYELFGMGDATKNPDIMGLKTIKQGATLSELEGPFSKLGYLALSTGRDFNSFLSLVSKDTGKAANAVGGLVKSLGEGINYIGTYLGMGANLIGQPELAGMVKTGAKVASKPLEYVGDKTSGLGQYGIDIADYIKKNATGPTAGIVQSVGPMLGVAAAGGLALPQLIKIYDRLADSADDYKNKLNDEIGATEKEQSTIRSLISEYKRMDKLKKKLVTKADEGALVTEDSFGNTKGIATQLAKLEDQYTDFKNKVATSDINFLVGYTLQGDAVLKGGIEDNLSSMLRRSSGKKQFEVAGKKMDIAARYANEATQTDGIQSWKYHIKEIVKNFPLIGEKLGEAINVGPKKAMSELQKSLHKMLTAKNANPLSNAFDDAIKELQEKQIELQAAIKIDAKQAKNIIDSIDTSDMSPLEIDATFNKEIYDDLYELLAMSSTIYKRAGVTGADVRGQHVLSAATSVTNPSYKGYLEPTADLTMERFRDAGLTPRVGSGGTMPVKVGDILKLSEAASKDLGGVSGRQAVLGSERYEEDGKILTKHFLSFADAEGKYRKKFIPGIKALDGMVQAAVSLSEVSTKLSGDFASLSEMVTGASAGMSALDKKSLTKRSVSLGPKFYSDIATEVLLQTNKGYDVKTRSYTTPMYKENYADEFITNYAEKMEKWETTLASYRAEDKPVDTKLTGGFGEQLRELQDVLKNNSVVMQFRAALEDLSKTIEASDAALVKNIALEKQRYEAQKNLSGLMAGIPEGLENFDVGTFELKDLSSSQRMLYDDRGSQELVKAFNIEKKRRDAYTSQMESITSTMLDVQRINETSLGFSSRFTTQAEFDKYAETIKYTGGDLGSAEIVSAVDASSDLLNQSNTELIAIKTGIYEVADLLKSPEDRWSSKVEKAQIDVSKAEKGNFFSNKSVAGAMRIAGLQRIQSATAAEGRSEEAALMEKDIGKLTKELISRTSVGDVVRSLTPVSKEDQYKILNSAISESGYSAADIVDHIGKAAVGNKSLYKEQRESIKKGVGAYKEATTKKEPSFFNTDTAGFGALGLSIFAGSSAARKNEQVTELNKRIGNVQKEIAAQGEKPDPKLLTELEALKRTKGGAEASAMVGSTLQQLSTTGFLTYAGSKAAMGNSDAATAKLMMGAVATHTLFKSMGMENLKKVPEFAKDFDKFLKGMGEKIGTVVKNRDPKAVEEALKKHGSKVKDRINEAAKEYFIGLKKYSEIQGKETGKTDADVAVEVESAKKMYSSNKKAKERRAAIEEEFAVQSDAGKQFVLDLVKLETAMGLVRAAFSDAASDAKISGMENTAEEQTKIFFEKIYNVSPKFANDIISSIVSGRDVDTLPIERGEPIKGPSTAFNVDDSINAVLAELHDQLAAVGGDQSKSNQLLSVLASATALKKRFTTLITTLETFNRSLHDSVTSMELSAKYQGSSTFGDILKGYIGDIKTAQSYSEFSPQQQIYAGGSSAFKELLTDYQKGSKLMDKYVTALSNFESEVYSSEETIKSLEEKFNMLKNSGEATDGELEATAQTLTDNKKILETRRKVLKDTTTEADRLSKSMKNVQRALKSMTEFQTAFKGFQDSMVNATANWFTQSEAGLKDYYDQRDKLLGGSHPEAAIAVSVEDQRLADALGMSLTSGVSNQYDLQKVKLEDAYIKAQESGSSPEEMGRILTQLADLDTQRERDVITYEQKKQNELTAASVQPAAKLYEDLERLRFTKPDALSTEQFADIDELNNIIKVNLSNAYDKVSGATRIQELEQFKSDRGYLPGSKETLNIDKIISTIKPDDTMYRGANPLEIKSAYDELMSKYSQYAVSEEQQNLKTYVNEPLRGILDYVKIIAAKIAPEASLAVEEAMSDREQPKKTEYNDWQFYEKAGDSDKYRELLGLDRPPSKKPVDDWQFYTGKSTFSDVDSDKYRALMGMSEPTDYAFNTNYPHEDKGPKSNYNSLYGDLANGMQSVPDGDTLFTGKLPSKESSDAILSFDSISRVFNSLVGALKDLIIADKESAGRLPDSNAIPTISTGNRFSVGGPFGDHPKSVGGHVSGPGGPREDKVPALLSRGEYVIKADSALKLGHANLDHMNRKGALPAFADGGFVNSITKGKGFRTVSGGMQSLIDDLEVGRLSSVKEEGLSLKGVGKQAAFATGELVSRLAKVPLDIFSGVEGTSEYLANKGLSGALKDVSKIKDSVLNKVATEGIMGTVSGAGSSLYGSITDSLSKGGLGITTDIMGSLAGGTGVMSKFNKLTDVGTYIKATKMASGDGKGSKIRDMLSVIANESGAIDNPAMVVKDLVGKSKPKVERKFPSLYDRFSPMKKDPTRKAGYNRDMLAIDKFNREYTEKYGVDFGFSRENFLPRQFLPDMGKTIDSYMKRYPELKDHLSFIGSTEFTNTMPVDDILRLAGETGDPLHNRGKHSVVPTRKGPAGVVQISNINAIKKRFVQAKKDNIPLQSVADDVKGDLLYTLGHELSHGINKASKNKIHMAEINAVLDKLPDDAINNSYITSKKVGDPARAKERFADFGAKFEKIMTDPARKDNPTMFDMSPEDAVAAVYDYDTRLTSWGDDMVSNLFPGLKLANGGVVGYANGGYVSNPEERLDAKRLDMAKAIYGDEHRIHREEDNDKYFSGSWLDSFNKKSEKFKKEQWTGKAAEKVDPTKVRSFTNIGPGGDILSEIVETIGKYYEPARKISGIDKAVNDSVYEKSWGAQDITDYLNNSISSDNNIRRGEDRLPHKWGYDTAAAAQSNVRADAKAKADSRLLKVKLGNATFKANTEQILSTRHGLEKGLAKHIKDKGSIAGIEESMNYGDYAFDPYRGVHKFTTNVGGRDVSAGVIEQSSYRYANKSYRPTNIKPSKKATPHANMWTKTYKDLIPQEEFGMDFNRQIPKRGTVDSVALKYYKDARLINQRMGDLAEKLQDENLDPKDKLKYLKQLNFQSKAMSAYSKFDEVTREGANPFTDKRLMEETTKMVPNLVANKSLSSIEGVETIKDKDGKLMGYKTPGGKFISAYTKVTEKKSLLNLIDKAGTKAFVNMYKRKPLSAGSVTKAPVGEEMLSQSWFDKQNHASSVAKRYITPTSGFIGKLGVTDTVKDTGINYFGGDTLNKDIINKMIENFSKGQKKSDWEDSLGFGNWLEGYNIGGSASLDGHVPGAGGHRDDKFPALLSSGEYVIRAPSAQKLGYANLDHMNKKGSIPAFADGGTLGNIPTTTPSTNFTNTSANLSLNVPKIELDVSEAISELRSIVLKVDKTPLEVDSKSVELPAVSIDSREFLSDLSNIELKLEDKPVQIDTTPLKDVILKVEDKKLSLEEGAKVEVDVSNISAAATEAGLKISQSITNAIKSAAVKIEVASSGEVGQVGQGVGAERLDLLAATIDTMDKRLINTTTKIETEVKELEVNLELKLAKDLDVRLASKLSGIQEDVGSLSTSMTSFSDNVTSQISRVSMKALEAERLAKQALDFRNLK